MCDEEKQEWDKNAGCDRLSRECGDGFPSPK